MKINALKLFRIPAALILLCAFSPVASAGLFDDEEARRAILDLRQKVETLRTEDQLNSTRVGEEATAVRRSLLELQNQIELLRTELANLRGLNEQLSRELAETQRKQKDISQALDERFRQLEPIKVSVDSQEFLSSPDEKREFETTLSVFRKGEFAPVQKLLLNFIRRHPASGYVPSALFWLGNAQYATRDYNEAMINFNAIVDRVPTHLRAAEALLSVANCQVELKDLRGAKKTLEDLLINYPQSEAAEAAKERLSKFK